MNHCHLPADHVDRMARAHLSLDGLSVGDAFGDRFFSPAARSHWDAPEPYLPPPPWFYSDDTEMALGIVEVLERHGTINQDDLARTFVPPLETATAPGLWAVGVPAAHVAG